MSKKSTSKREEKRNIRRIRALERHKNDILSGKTIRHGEVIELTPEDIIKKSQEMTNLEKKIKDYMTGE